MAHRENLYFSKEELRTIFKIIFNNSKSNGPLHTSRMHTYRGRLLSIPELFHYVNLSDKSGLNLTKDIRCIDHPISIYSSSTEILACMFTTQQTTFLPGIGCIKNFRLTDSSFAYTTGLIRSTPMDFYSHVSIFHDVNYIPQNLLFGQYGMDLRELTHNSALAYAQTFDGVDLGRLALRSFNSSTGFSETDIEYVDSDLLNQIRTQNELYRSRSDRINPEVERTLRYFREHLYTNYRLTHVNNTPTVIEINGDDQMRRLLGC